MVELSWTEAHITKTALYWYLERLENLPQYQYDMGRARLAETTALYERLEEVLNG